MKRIQIFLTGILAMFFTATSLHAVDQLEEQFRRLPREARRLTGPLFWMHGDKNESESRLEAYLEKVAEGGNGSFTCESRPHSDWLGPGWYKDLAVCLKKAKQLDLKMWIFDERWWPSQSIGGKVPPRYAAKSLVADAVAVQGGKLFESDGYAGERYIGTVAGRLNEKKEIVGESLIDLASFIENGKLTWKAPAGNWQVIKFTHKQAPGLGQRGGKELSVDGASRDCTDWFIQEVYQPHYDHFKDDFGKAIAGYFYDEPETKGDWGTELNVILKEWGVDWKKAYVAYTSKLAGDDDVAARYQYMEAMADAWGRVMYGSMTQWCHDRDVVSIGHFMEHGNLYLRPDYCGGDMMRVQKYSDMGGIDLVCQQMYPGQRPGTIYQTPKLASSISHVYGKKDDLAMCEIFGGYNQHLTYPEMKWLTDQMQVRGVNFMIPHSFNPKAPYDRDYPPYFYNDGHEPRWPLYRVWADYTSRLSLMLTGGRHVSPVAMLFSGNARRVGKYVTPEEMTTVLQDALYDCDWLPFEAFEGDASLEGKTIVLHQERYQVLVVPPTDLIPYATLAKVKAFFDQGGVVVGYGFLPSKSGTIGRSSGEIAELRDSIWGRDAKVGTKACKTSAGGGRAYFLAEKPDVAMVSAALGNDAGIPPAVEVLEGETNNWLHVLHRVKNDKDIFLLCNQDHLNKRKTFRLKLRAKGFPEIWDAMRNQIHTVEFNRRGQSVQFNLDLEPMESVLIVFNATKRDLPARLTAETLGSAEYLSVIPEPAQAPLPSLLKAVNGVTKSPVAAATPFSGKCNIPASVDLKKQRIVIEMDELTPEEAARVTINGNYAGGFIGRPFRLEVTQHLKQGENTVMIEPFAPKSVRFLVLDTLIAKSTDKRPNIIYILADDMGYGDVSALNPESKIQTPNIDRLAKEGMHFTDAHSGSAVCTPTRYGILTGRYCWRSRLKQGVLNGYSKHLIEDGRLTVAALLKQSGYNTACIGKWHLGMDMPTTDTKTPGAKNVDWKGMIKNSPTTRGFDYFYGIAASLDMHPYIYIENDTFVGECTATKAFHRKGPAHADFEAVDVLPTISRKTVDFINQQGSDKPFFAYVALTSPHTPVVPSKKYQGTSVLGDYGDFCIQTDAVVGEICEALDKKGLSNETLVIFTSDNGCAPYIGVKDLEKKGHYPSYIYRGYKADIFEGGHRVPFVVRWPSRINPSGKSTETICLTDLMATCAEIVGKTLPADAGEDSYSILPALLGESRQQPIREATVHHSINGSFSIRQGKWKLELCPGSGGWGDPNPKKAKSMELPLVQLYDMESDIREKTNLQDKYPEIVRHLTALLESYKLTGRSVPR